MVENTTGAPDRNFEISFYKVNTGADDTLIKTVEGTLVEDDAITEVRTNPLADSNINVALLGTVNQAGAGLPGMTILSSAASNMATSQ